MTTFNYKKWVTDYKQGKPLFEQTTGSPSPSGCPGCNSGNGLNFSNNWGDIQNWQTTFNNNLQTASWANNPGQPCQFLQNKINQWTSTQQGLGGCNAYWNILACKIKHATILMEPGDGGNNC